MSTHYREFFSKRSGRDEKDRDPINYPLRTAFDGRRRNSKHETTIKKKFHERLPIMVNSIEFKQKKVMEKKFVPNFHLMASSDNGNRHRLEREYFDRPYLTVRDAPSGFAPVISRPRLLSFVKSPRAFDTGSNEGEHSKRALSIKPIRTSDSFFSTAKKPKTAGRSFRIPKQMQLLTTGLSE